MSATETSAFYVTTACSALADENVSAGIFRPRANSLPCKHAPEFFDKTTLNPALLPPSVPPKKAPFIPCLTASALVPPPYYSTLAEQDRTPPLKSTARSSVPYHVYANVVSGQLQDGPSRNFGAFTAALSQPVTVEIEPQQSDATSDRQSARRSRTDIKPKREFDEDPP